VGSVFGAVRRCGLLLLTMSVCHTSELCKNGCTDRDAVWFEDSGGPRNHVLDWGPDPPMGRGSFEWEGRPIVKYRDTVVTCVKMAKQVVMPFGLWARTGQRTMNKMEVYVHHEMGCFQGKGRPLLSIGTFCHELCRRAEPIGLPFGLWTGVGRRKHKFDRIRQEMPMCPHGRAHWRHLANTIEPSICSADAVLRQITLTTCFRLCMKYFGNHSVILRQIHAEDMFGPSLRQV